MKRGEIDIRRELDIDFVDEDWIDAKGLTREYLNLVLQGITNGTGDYVLFEGRQIWGNWTPLECRHVHVFTYWHSIVNGKLQFYGVTGRHWKKIYQNLFASDKWKLIVCQYNLLHGVNLTEMCKR